MKSIMLIFLLMFSLVVTVYAWPPLPSCYHTYDEITAELQQIQTQYPTYAKVYNIGHSQQDSIPIYALKISDHVNDDEADEPAVVFVGQVHAEEVLGVETVMSNIKEILANRLSSPYQSWTRDLEMWFIPTLNPEGHNIVTSNIDVTFRKNLNDVNHNGLRDIDPRVGYDLDGVDINRNFSTNWCHGDTLWQPAQYEQYDYYMGPAPMSESEVKAFKSFCDAQKPIYCIVWHSARNEQGGLNEKVFYPLNWAGVRPAPDLALGQQIGEGVASQIQKIGGGTYSPSAALGRKGGVNDWMYQQYGTICLVIECGLAPNIQPDSLDTSTSLGMLSIVDRNSNGVWWLLNRALRNSSVVTSNSMLTGTITDDVTNQPLEAEIVVLQKNAPWFAPRKSDPLTGRYWRPLSTGTYDILFRKKGYYQITWNGVNVNNGSWTYVDLRMFPFDPITLTGTVRNSLNDQLVPAKVVLYDVENDTLQTNGEFMVTTYPGAHRIEITAEGYYPYVDTLFVNIGSQTLNVEVNLSPVTTVYSENWENGTSNWTINGPWVLQNQLAVYGNAITDSWGGRGFYAQECNVWIQTNEPIQIPATDQKMLTFDEHLYTEFVYDSVRVEVSTDNSIWRTIYSNSGQYDWWHPVYIPLDEFYGQSLYFRFRLTDHSTEYDLTDPGWTLDNIRIIAGNASLTPNSDETIVIKPVTVLYPNFPNPFNPETSIKFSTSTDSKVEINIYNLKGQKVKRLTDELYKKGTHTLVWNGKDDNNKSVASGIYFCKMKTPDKTKTLKMVLMK